MKRIVSILLTMTVLFSLMTVAVSADTTEVTVTGEILTTIIDVEIPTTASFTINPNIPEGTEGRYIMPNLFAFNRSTAPVTLSIINFDNKAGSDNQFTEVERGDKNWGELGASDSTSYIYLGITGTNDQWGFLNHTEFLSTPSALEVQSGPQTLCNLRSDTGVEFMLECQSGSAFPDAITSVYELIFVAELYDDKITDSSIIDLDISGSGYNWNPNPIEESVIVFDSYTLDLNILTESDNTNYLINGLDYQGSQATRVDTKFDDIEQARYIEIEYMYQGDMVIKNIYIDELRAE